MTGTGNVRPFPDSTVSPTALTLSLVELTNSSLARV